MIRELLLVVAPIIYCIPAFTQTDTTVFAGGEVHISDYGNGKQILRSSSMGTYIGRFEAGIPIGICTHYAKDGGKYHGEFVNGLYHGKGRLITANGNIYAGDFECGKPNGLDSISLNRSRSVYIGECKNGTPHGSGILIIYYPGGNQYFFYEGDFKEGKLMNGYYSSASGEHPMINGVKSYDLKCSSTKSQSELMDKYLTVRYALSKFNGEKRKPAKMSSAPRN